MEPPPLIFRLDFNASAVYDPCTACVPANATLCPSFLFDCVQFEPDVVHIRRNASVKVLFDNPLLASFEANNTLPPFVWTLSVVAQIYPSAENLTLVSPLALTDPTQKYAGVFFSTTNLTDFFKIFLIESISSLNATEQIFARTATYTFRGQIDPPEVLWPAIAPESALRPIVFGGTRAAPSIPPSNNFISTATSNLASSVSVGASSSPASTIRPSPSPSSLSSPSSNASGLGTEAYIAIFAVVCLIIIVVIAFICLRRRILRRSNSREKKSAEQIAADDLRAARRAAESKNMSPSSRPGTLQIIVADADQLHQESQSMSPNQASNTPVSQRGTMERGASFETASWISASYARNPSLSLDSTAKRKTTTPANKETAASVHSAASVVSRASRVLARAAAGAVAGDVAERERESEEEEDDPDAWRREGEDEEELRARNAIKTPAKTATSISDALQVAHE